MGESFSDAGDLFAERCNKFSVRDFKNNTRLNINNSNWSAQWEKRDRAMRYWQNNVIQNHLPHIDRNKQIEMQALKRQVSLSQVHKGGNKPEFQVSLSIKRRQDSASPFGKSQTIKYIRGSPDSNKKHSSSAKRKRKVLTDNEGATPHKPAYNLFDGGAPSQLRKQNEENMQGFNLVSWNDLEAKDKNQ